MKKKLYGLINIPDHVYDIKDESSIFPNHIDYGFCYLSINEFAERIIRQNAMKEANISDETVFDNLMPNFNYKDYLVYNYIMIDVDNEENKNNVKKEIEEKNGDEKESNNIFVDSSNGYIRFLNHNSEYIKLSDNGVYVTEKLANTKGYKIED